MLSSLPLSLSADSTQAEAAVQRDLLPPIVPHNYAPTPLPIHVYQIKTPLPGSRCNPFSSTDEGVTEQPTAGATTTTTQVGAVPRRKSVTPRSVLDFEEAVAQVEQAGSVEEAHEGNECGAGEPESSDSKRQKVDHELKSWVDNLML